MAWQGAGPGIGQARPPLHPLPPLAPGWTEHVGPHGQPYYYHAGTGQSTYARPSAHAAAGPSSVPAPSSAAASMTATPASESNGKPKMKEKPATKEPIEGAEGWLKVTTNLGNVFYTHKESKRSEWVIPDEIREAVRAMEAKQRAQREEEEAQIRQKEKEANEEAARRASELQRAREEQERIRVERERLLAAAGKRKRGEAADEDDEGEADAGMGELNGGGVDVNALLERQDSPKRSRLDDENGNEAAANDEIDDEDDEDDEAWQRKVAAEMAAETEREQQEQRKQQQQQAPSHTQTNITFPPPPPKAPEPYSNGAKVELSLEEGKALFMQMLTSFNGTDREVNPMAPWDKELAKFVHHPRYTVLAQLRDRQDAFNEWCKLRLREKRKKGGSSAAAVPTSSTSVAAVPVPTSGAANGSDPSLQRTSASKEDAVLQYQALLESEVTSTRTRWEDFRKKHKRDRPFFGFGRDDREREKVFRSYLRDLGEKKRLAAEKAENDFMSLLDEKLSRGTDGVAADATQEEVNSTWTRAKKKEGVEADKRYEAVGSSSRRAELFGLWAKGERRAVKNSSDSSAPVSQTRKSDESSSKAEQALREREERVRREQRQVQGANRRALGQAHHQEGLVQFGQLLMDTIRNPLSRWTDSVEELRNDSRYSMLEDAEERRRLFDEHVDGLNRKRLRELQGTVFERHAPTLDIDAEVVVPLILDDEEVARRKLDQLKALESGKTMQDLFEEWQEEKEERAKAAFREMLKENAFVEFWGSLRQQYQTQGSKAGSEASRVEGQGQDNDEDEDLPTLLQMAAKIDLDEIFDVLRNDQRFRAFAHVPDKREEWIRDYLQNMKVPKTTVFQRN